MGCGWLGLPLAESLLKKGHSVKGTTTSEDKREQLLQLGIEAFCITLTESAIIGNIAAFLDGTDILIVNVPPRLRGPKKENYVLKIQRLCEQLPANKTVKVVFVSSTSVYGDVTGEITESTPPRPATESGKQLLEAEKIMLDRAGQRTTIIRFGGLIGPDRHPIKQLAGKTGLKNGDHVVNLIHLTDCIFLIEQIIANLWWGELFNGVFPEHPTKRAFYRAAAIKAGVAPPSYLSKNGDNGKKVISERLYNVKMLRFNTSVLP